MTPSQKPERHATDQRLRDERRRTDEKLQDGERVAVERSEAVLKTARDRSDAALVEFRAQEDSREQGAASQASHESLESERRHQDAEIARERQNEDKSRSDERAERRELFRALLAEHRLRTDAALSSERSYADASLEARDTFLGIVSHDVRGMVAAISLSAQVMSKSLAEAPPPELKSGVERIQRVAEQISALVKDLLDVSAIAAGQFVVEPVEQDMVAVVRDALDTIQPLAAEKDIQIRGPEIEQAPARIDEPRILQVLANLLGNAIKFSKPGLEIRVELQCSGDAVECTVTDFGVGIAADSIEKIFERFQRGARRDVIGVGLGLYIAKAIVESHGGRIWVESQVGRGSTFHFTVPAAGNHRR